MDLKKAIVVRSEYTIKNSSSKGGSRGGTPGNFVLQYMSREDATEIDTPVTVDDENFYERYRIRMETAEKAETDQDMEYGFYKSQKRGGVAFNEHELSLSYKDLVLSSKEIQDAFNEGKTVMKVVISFEEEYLREYGIIPEDFTFQYRGDYKGNIDQMKLRYAIAGGMERASEDYHDLHYVGTIQVDTAHIHCHLAMVDLGEGTLTEEGTQKGKISAATKNKIRHGIDTALTDASEIHYMPSAVKRDDANKQLNHDLFIYRNRELYSAPQQIISVLPEDREMWHTGSNRKEMEQADRLCHEYVRQMIDQHGSKFDGSDVTLMQYEMQQKKEQDREETIQRGMEDVYTCIREMPLEFRSATPLQNYAAQDTPQPSFKNDMQDFVYRVRTYKKRYEHHRDEADRFASYIHDYESDRMNGRVSEDSAMIYQYFKVEQQYQEMLASKYSHFIQIDESVDRFMREYVELSQRERRIESMVMLMDDDDVRNMDAQEAEMYGRTRYDVYGGQYIAEEPQLFKEIIDRNRDRYEMDHREFQSRLDSAQLSLMFDDDGSPHIRHKQKYSFDDVKGLDLHELKGDFNEPLEYSDSVRDAYVRMAEERIAAYDDACRYLDGTGQSNMKSYFDRLDIELMRRTLEDVKADRNIGPQLHDAEPVKERRTIMLDMGTHTQIRDAVYSNLLLNNAGLEDVSETKEDEFQL